MTKHEVDTDSPAPPESGAKPTTSTPDFGDRALAEARQNLPVDVTEYKTDELKERFQQLFGVTHFLPWAAAGFGGSIVVSLGLWLVLFLPRASLAIGVLTLIYMALQGIFVGIFAAAVLIVARILQQVSAIVDITIQTIRRAFVDVKKVGDPGVRSELTGALLHGAIVPTIPSAITVKLGLLRAPISFVLNGILKKTAEKLTDSIEERFVSGGDDDDEAEAPTAIDDNLSDDTASAGLLERGDSHLDNMQSRIEVVARRTRRATLIPAAILFVLAAGLTSIPWLVALFLLV